MQHIASSVNHGRMGGDMGPIVFGDFSGQVSHLGESGWSPLATIVFSVEFIVVSV